LRRFISRVARIIRSIRATIANWGPRGLWYRATGNVDGLYSIWVRRHTPDDLALEAERSNARAARRLLGLITFVAHADDWPGARTVASVAGQTYSKWEWILVATDRACAVTATALETCANDLRVRIIRQPAGTTRADAWNAAVQAATAEFIALLESHDELSLSALSEFAAAIDRTPASDLVYSDEDALGARGRRERPRFKPSWSPELLLAENYIGRLSLVRRELVTGPNGFRNGFDGAEEWDLFLRLSRRAERTTRVPLCLYHRAQGTRAELPDAGAQAVADHCRQLGLEAAVSTSAHGWRVTWPVPHDLLVSIVIPNRDAPEVISQCVRGLLDSTSHPRRELIIVDNASTNADVLSLYRSLETDRRATIVPFNRPFNFSAACNAGAASAHGELLLFLNNDIEVIDPDWLSELARWALRPDIGIVGAKLLYPDRTIQHAGVAFGIGLVGHVFSRAPEGTTTLFGSSETYRNYTAVTGACQMMRRGVFEELGGFDERFRLSFSDVVICMEAWARGYRVMYTPYARLVHHESFTRRREDSLEDLQRLVAYLRQHHVYDDPYFHPELNPESAVPELRPPFAAAPEQVVRHYVDRVLTEAAVAR
jgi:GT2 family glycosyltransferase